MRLGRVKHFIVALLLGMVLALAGCATTVHQEKAPAGSKGTEVIPNSGGESDDMDRLD